MLPSAEPPANFCQTSPFTSKSRYLGVRHVLSNSFGFFLPRSAPGLFGSALRHLDFFFLARDSLSGKNRKLPPLSRLHSPALSYF